MVPALVTKEKNLKNRKNFKNHVRFRRYFHLRGLFAWMFLSQVEPKIFASEERLVVG